MESEFDRDQLLDSLNALPFQAILAFALSCAERLYPNYLRFSREHSWGDPLAIRDALDYAWGRLLGRSEIQILLRLEASPSPHPLLKNSRNGQQRAAPKLSIP